MEDHVAKANRLLTVTIQAGGMLAAGLGILALTGWLLGFPLLASLGKGYIPMAPSTALLLVINGAALFFSSRKPLSRRMHSICMVIGSAGTLVALLLFFLSYQGIYTNAEHLGIHISRAMGGAPVGHMSPVTAFCFVLTGLSFLASLHSSSGTPKRVPAALGFAYATILICFALLLAYFLGTPLFYERDIIPPALSTALAFIALGISLCAFAELHTWRQHKLTKFLTTQGSHILVLILAVMSIGIVTAGYFYYRIYEKRYLLEVESQLSAIAEFKTRGIMRYREERLGDASLLFKNLPLSTLVGRFLENPHNAQAHEQLHTWLNKVQSHYPYESIFLLDRRGALRMSLPREAPVDPITLQRASDALQSRQVVFQDFYRDNHARRIYLAILVPVLDGKDGDRPVGVLVLRIDPEEYLYPFITRLSTASRTAETVLIRREGNEAVFLNELRFQKNAALNRRISLERKELPAVQAVLGLEGAISGRDPRGISFVAYVRAIPDSPWFLVARTDVSEVSAPLRERLWIVVALVIALLTGSGMSIGFIWQGQKAQFYREKYAATEKLLESEARYRSLASTADAMYLVDRHGRYLFTNEGFLKRFGLSADQVIGKTFVDFHTAESTANFSMNVEEVFNTGNSVQHERQSPRDGRHFLHTYSPVRDHEGNVITAVTVVAKDITDRKRAEEELYQSQKLTSLGIMAGGIAHEIRNPLAICSSAAQFLHNDDVTPTFRRECMEKICSSIQRISTIIENLLKFAHPSYSTLNNQVNPINLVTLVKETMTLANYHARINKIETSMDFGVDTIMVQGAATLLQQVFMNLFLNAINAMPGGGALFVSVEVQDQEAHIRVRDTGCGIPQAHIGKIFDPFYTTSAVSKGVGLGLSICYSIVKQHSGTIEVESIEGKGSIFTVRLPVK